MMRQECIDERGYQLHVSSFDVRIVIQLKRSYRRGRGRRTEMRVTV